MAVLCHFCQPRVLLFRFPSRQMLKLSDAKGGHPPAGASHRLVSSGQESLKPGPGVRKRGHQGREGVTVEVEVETEDEG